MKTRLASAFALVVMGTLTSGVYAVDRSVPYKPVHPINGGQTGTTLIYPAQLHPEVAVNRTLNAQPVHPWMAQVGIGGSGPYARRSGRVVGGAAAMTTYIDPLQRIDGSGALDEGHSLVRAQRLHNQLSGMTTNDVAALRNHSLSTEPHGGIANGARIITPMRPRAGGDAANQATVILRAGPAERIESVPAPRRSVPIPAVPKPNKNADDAEKVASAADAPAPMAARADAAAAVKVVAH